MIINGHTIIIISHAVILKYGYKHDHKKNRIFKYTKRGVDNAIREQIKYLLDKKAPLMVIILFIQYYLFNIIYSILFFNLYNSIRNSISLFFSFCNSNNILLFSISSLVIGF